MELLLEMRIGYVYERSVSGLFILFEILVF